MQPDNALSQSKDLMIPSGLFVFLRSPSHSDSKNYNSDFDFLR